MGVYAIFMPMHFMGVSGAPRRYAQLTEFQYLQHLQPLQLFISVAAFVTIAAQVVFVFNFFWSMLEGPAGGHESMGIDLAGVEYPFPASAR